MSKTVVQNLLGFFTQAAKAAPSAGINKVSSGIHEQRFIVAGASVIPEKPRQPVGTVEELMEKSQEVKAEFEKLVKDFAGKIQASGVYIAPDKLASRISQKARTDYDGKVERVVDPIRATIEIKSLGEYRRATRLFSPADNSSVVRFQDGFAKPDNDGGLRRILVNYKLSNGMIAEIQVRHAGMEKAYDKTAGLYSRIRAFRAELEDHTKERSEATTNAMSHKLHTWLDKRKKLHDDAATKAGMDAAILKRDFFFVNGFPVVKLFSPATGEYETLIPDVKSGRFVRDNRLLTVIDDPEQNVSRDVPRDAFIAKCVALVRSPEVGRIAEMPQQSLQLNG